MYLSAFGNPLRRYSKRPQYHEVQDVESLRRPSIRPPKKPTSASTTSFVRQICCISDFFSDIASLIQCNGAIYAHRKSWISTVPVHSLEQRSTSTRLLRVLLILLFAAYKAGNWFHMKRGTFLCQTCHFSNHTEYHQWASWIFNAAIHTIIQYLHMSKIDLL